MEVMMRGFSMVVVASASAGFLASVALASEERKIPDSVTVLTEAELRQNIVGSTVTGGSGDGVWVEYYEPGGRIRGIEGGSPYGGAWTIEGQWFCVDYGGTDYDNCLTMSRKGDRITFYYENGEPSKSPDKRLIPGEEAAPPPFTLGQINTNFWGEVAIKGYDPVAYFVDGAAQKGSEEFAYEWLGATWHFASAAHRDLFIEDPIRYAPQYGGYCSLGLTYGATDGTDPEAWRIVDGKLYLYFSKKTLANWERDKNENIGQADANWPQVLAELVQ
jgi:YHS domain-containing protein